MNSSLQHMIQQLYNWILVVCNWLWSFWPILKIKLLPSNDAIAIYKWNLTQSVPSKKYSLTNQHIPYKAHSLTYSFFYCWSICYLPFILHFFLLSIYLPTGGSEKHPSNGYRSERWKSIKICLKLNRKK